MELQLPRWKQLPEIALYMDQVQLVLGGILEPLTTQEGPMVTPTMINNYVKMKLTPPAEKKKYGREHLAYLTAICLLKHVMSTRDMDLLLNEELQGGRTVAQGYGDFCASLDGALTLTAREMEQYTDEEALADAAIHFALMSYAAGVASSRYVALLCQQREAAGEAQHSHGKDKSKKELK